MRILTGFVITLSVIIAISGAVQADPVWKLVWEDNFERTEIGDEWTVHKGASIENGSMRMEDTVWAMINRSFAADVRLEYDARPIPGIPPCDISATLGSGELKWGYLLGFGAQGNHANHLRGPGVDFEDKNPPFLIEQGKNYHLIAQKEGKRITYTVNGTTIINVKTDDPVSGPGFDKVGILTWTGMYADNVKVYERITPHPDTPAVIDSFPEGPIYRDGRTLKIKEGSSTPALEQAVKSFNEGKLTDALQQFRAMGKTLPGLLGQAYVLGDLNYYEKFLNEEFKKLAADFKAASAANPNDKVTSVYAVGADWFARFKMQRNSAGAAAAIRFRNIGPENNPFYYKANLYEARYLYWNGKEGANHKAIAEAVDQMRELKKIWPENTILRQYTGEDVPWGNELIADTERHPAWAAYLREAYAREIKLMEKFFTDRQSADGQLGGGYGDDVELLRTWVPVAAISSGADKVRDGIEKLCEGVWDNVLLDGYDESLTDVEHSAEPSADSIPGMLILRYGDPLWVERNLQTCKNIKDYYMGIDKKGYPRFKASIFGGKKFEPTIMGGGDTGYCARAMKHLFWAGWQGDPDATDWYVRWADGWRASTMTQEDNKLPGVVPHSIWYPSGSICPPVPGKTWHDEKLNYLTRCDMIYDVFLAAYYLSGDRKFLKPLQYGLTKGTTGPLPKIEAPRGSEKWQNEGFFGVPLGMSTEQNKTSVYRLLTGDTAYDEYIFRSGEPELRYKIKSDIDEYLKSFASQARRLRDNIDLQTTEVLSTDRAALGSAMSIFGAYTGAVSGVRDAATPTFTVTYDTPTADFAALVTTATTERLRVWLYNFDDKPMPVGLKLWRLRPGKYVFNQGEQLKGEAPGQYRYSWGTPKIVPILHRADGPTVTVPSGKVWAVDLYLDEPVQVPSKAPDLAVGRSDVLAVNNGLKVKVHNIGNADAGSFSLALQRKANGAWKTVETHKVAKLAAPKNLVPSAVSVTFKNVSSGDYRVRVDGEGRLFELCEANNTLQLK